MSKVPATVVILTKNEEASLPSCLAAVEDFDEIVVVDSHSDDRTVEIAAGAGARVVRFSWDGRYPKKKQWSLENASGGHDWVLMLDADERPSPTLVRELRALLADPGALAEVGAVDIPLEYQWQGRRLRFGHRVTKRALVHRQRVSFPVVDDLAVTNMWEVEGHYQPQTAWAVRPAHGRLLHHDEDPLYGWFARHNRYSDWEAHLRAASMVGDVARLRSAKGRRFASMPGKPLIFFLYAYVLRAGFLDGRAGFDYAVAQAFYYWQIDVKTRERTRQQATRPR